jgi:hypothetical protein
MNNQRNSFTRLSSSRISRIAAENAKTDCAAFASLRLCVSQRRDGLRFHRRSFALLLLAMLCWLAPGRAVAAPASGGPLPLPDLLIYGTVVDSNGDALESGTVKVVRNGETLATAEIGAVAGTDYTYLLVVPMGMLPPGSTDSADGVAQAGDTLSFLVDNQPAYFQDSITSLTVNTWQTPSGAAGRGFVLDLSLPGAMRYTLGDVNANGARNAADAMLTLKYDIGLILGVTTFPPGPNTVYLPLCDIVENGRCDSSDALRILQCDVGMTGVTCPVDSIPAGRTGQQPTPGAATRLQVLATAGGEPNTVDVRVLLSADAANFGAASFDLAYDPARFAPVDCVADGAAAFDLVACNQAMAPGRVRFNAVAAAGAADGAEVVAVRFHQLGAAEGDLAASFGLTADGMIDLEGAELPWAMRDADAPAPTPEAPVQHQLYLPAVTAPGGQATEDAAPAAGEPAPEAEPPAEPSSTESSPAPEPTQAPATTPTAETGDVALASHALFLPAIAHGQATAVGAVGAAEATATVTATVTAEDATPTPPAAGAAAPAVPPDATPTPNDTPVATLPPNEEQEDGADRPAQPAQPDDE